MFPHVFGLVSVNKQHIGEFFRMFCNATNAVIDFLIYLLSHWLRTFKLFFVHSAISTI